jgi:hypothetical protein
MIGDLGNFKRAGIPRKYRETGTIIIDSEDLSSFFKFVSGRRIYKSHSYPPSIDYDQVAKFVTILRDPRDVIVSSIFYLANLEPQKGGWGAKFKSLELKDRILQVIRNGDFALTRLEQWSTCERAFKVQYEDLLVDCSIQLIKLFEWLEIPVTKSDIDKVVQNHQFEMKSERKPGTEDRNSFYRKGISGDWINYFDTECIHAFKMEKNGRWNRLLVEMGYEREAEWSL